jgi:transposase
MPEVSPARRPYRSDLSDARWALIEPLLTEWRARRQQAGLGIRPPEHDLREIVNAILYVVRTGIAWEYLPHDFPPYKTVYDYYGKWEADGTTKALHDLLRQQVRVHKGRNPQPSAAVIDSQTVKTSSNVAEAEQGFDAAKRVKGRKRHIAIDMLGLLLVVIITAASVQDSAAGKQVLDRLAADHPTVSKTWVDGGYNNGVVSHGTAHGIDVEVVHRDPDAKGFKVLPRRWAVERSLGWLVLHRRLVRDYETLPQRSESVIYWAMIGNMLRTLTGESTPSWRESPDINPDIPSPT